MRLAIVIPVLNEAAGIESVLQHLAPMRARGTAVIVVDGGSTDDTPRRAAPFADRVLAAPRGRALQMNAGARAPEASSADVLLFLHADTRLPAEADRIVLRELSNSEHSWGRFDVQLDAPGWRLRLVEALMNLRSRLSGIATGDQGMFMRRTALARIGGVPDLPLMEDVAMSKALKRVGPPACLRERVSTSGRRWLNHGVFRTIALMWALRLAYFVGVPPARLARIYYGGAA